ncbi:N-acetyltransferase [Bacteroidales bacterium OttesenSCG-928-B11]|nr:N-acetyltransferase [Bacteroidales bacterium OttesenSCG-928-C03]MDL2312736.1 N-acetyltransferase [Bacteroidales bacterium OttesenSCG-928-B11]
MIKIIQKDNGKAGAFFAMDDNSEIGEMTYEWVNDDEIVITYTGVSPVCQNQGVGKKMVASCVDFARDGKVKVVPQCGFAKRVFDTTPDYTDVLDL